MTTVGNNYGSPVSSTANNASQDTSGWTPAQIIAYLKTLEQTASQVNESTNEKSSLADSMAQMAYGLQMLQVVIAKAGNQRTENDEKVSEAQVGAAQAQLKKVEDEIEQMIEAQKKAATEGFWQTFAQVFSAAVMDIVAVVTVQPELAVISTAMLALSMSGAFDKMTSALSSILQDAGMSSSAANILASVMVVVVVVVLTANMAPSNAVGTIVGDADKVASTAATIGADASEAATAAAAGEETSTIFSRVMSKLGEFFSKLGPEASNAESTAAAAAEEASTFSKMMSTLGKFFNKINLFNRLSIRTNLMILNGVQTALSTNLPVYGADAIASLKGMSDDEKKRLELILNIVAEVVNFIVSIGAGAAVAGATVAKTAQGTSGLLKGLAQSPKFMKITEYMLDIGRLVTAGTGIALGVNQIQQGKGEKELADLKAGYDLLKTAMDMSAEQIKEDQKAFSSAEARAQMNNQALGDLVKGWAEFTNLLTN